MKRPNGMLYLSLAVCLSAAGALLLSEYLLFLDAGAPFGGLAAGVTLLASGAVFCYLLTEKNPKLTAPALIVPAIIMFTFNVLPAVRFRVYSGTMSPDSLGEVYVAESTLQSGRWHGMHEEYLKSPETARYFSLLSVTIMPAVLSEITGLSLETLFSLIYPLMFSLLPVVMFLIAREVFKRENTAMLSAILFSGFYQFSRSQSAHQSVALLLLALVVFLVIKTSTSKRRSSQAAVLIGLIVGVVTSHYTVAYFLNAILLFVPVSPYLLELLGRAPMIGKRVVDESQLIELRLEGISRRGWVAFYCLVITLAWFAFSFTEGFYRDVGALMNSLGAIAGLLEPRWLTGPGFGYTSGALVTYWYYLESVVIILGFVFFLVRERKNAENVALAGAGAIMAVFLALFTFLPTLPLAIGNPGRIYSIALPLWLPFLGYLMISPTKGYRRFLVPAFIMLSFPLNLGLLSYDRFVLLAPQDTVPPTIAIQQTFVTEPESLLAQWTLRYVPPTQDIWSDVRWLAVFWEFGRGRVSALPYPSLVAGKYLLLSPFFTRDLVWYPLRAAPTALNASYVSVLTDRSDVIYEAAGCVVLAHP